MTQARYTIILQVACLQHNFPVASSSMPAGGQVAPWGGGRGHGPHSYHDMKPHSYHDMNDDSLISEGIRPSLEWVI